MPVAKTAPLSVAKSRARLRSQSKTEGRGVTGGSIDSPLTTPLPNSGLELSFSGDTEKGKDHVDSLLDAARKLTKEQRKSLLAQLALDLQTSKKDSSRDLDMWSHGVYVALTKVLAGHNYGELLVRKTIQAPAYWSPVQEFMEASGFSQCSVTERQGIYQLLGDLVVRSAARTSARKAIPLTLKFVASCSANVAATFEQEFPGYIASGLAKVVVRQLITQRSA